MQQRRPISDYENWTAKDFHLWRQETQVLINQTKRIAQKIAVLAERSYK